jgi:hypothetical protein
MANRRDFLKLFSAGAVVAPVLNGLALSTSAQARIIEPPKIEIIPPPELVLAPMPSDEIVQVDVNIRTKSGNRYHIAAKCFVMESRLFQLAPAQRRPTGQHCPGSL